jgi:translation elongation factor EF-1alpha
MLQPRPAERPAVNADPSPCLTPSGAPPAPGLPLRLPIHDVSRSKGGALGVGGKLESGALRVGTKVMLLPGGEVGTVKSLEVNGQV